MSQKSIPFASAIVLVGLLAGCAGADGSSGGSPGEAFFPGGGVQDKDVPSGDPEGPTPSSCPQGMAPTLVGVACIDLYEASRPDATASVEGTMDGAARSVPGVLPWTYVDWDGARSACLAAGKRLCSKAEWDSVCSPDGRAYPFEGDWDPDACNGAAHGLKQTVPTGSMAGCRATNGAFDIAGNVWEWTDACEGSRCWCRGGACNGSSDDLACTNFFGLGIYAKGLADFNVGFRCCL